MISTINLAHLGPCHFYYLSLYSLVLSAFSIHYVKNRGVIVTSSKNISIRNVFFTRQIRDGTVCYLI